MVKQIAFTIFGVLGVLALGAIGVTLFESRRPQPSGETGPAAEALADRMEAAVNLEAFRALSAVAFTFGPRNRRHLADFHRDYVQVEWRRDAGPLAADDARPRSTQAAAFDSGADRLRVQYDRRNPGRCRAWRNAIPVGIASDSDERRELCKEAYRHHTNDFFWLAPWSQLRAPGAIRERVADRALLVRYPEGGVTPGDVYLYVLDREGLPQRWELWTDALSIQGAVFRFAEWQTTPEGARFNLRYTSELREVAIEDLQTWPRFPPPDESDPFVLSEARQRKPSGE